MKRVLSRIEGCQLELWENGYIYVQGPEIGGHVNRTLLRVTGVPNTEIDPEEMICAVFELAVGGVKEKRIYELREQIEKFEQELKELERRE